MKGLFSDSDKLVSLLVFLVGAAATLIDHFWLHLEIDVDTLALFLGIASIATIWIPGAGLPTTENWQKWVLTHATMALLGAATGAIIVAISSGKIGPTSASLGMMVCIAVFVAFWSSGHQSRDHVMQTFDATGWSEHYPQLNLLLGVLSSGRIKRHDIARTMRETVMDQNLEAILNEDAWRRLEVVLLEGTAGHQRARLLKLMAAVKEELKQDLPQLRAVERP